ncbi:helix-turn-helix domain-containing protein [Pseudoclavibacter sp. VKM Ac-2888]|uniref:helix-turn-helix domain-containing protein n=1 Tax=Pseudoclavibacter sp. VKM Ac-2888 TaxID=2783830 RepID=UPI00188B77D2|nr:helix-turn-helix domain-containing protein [Pseudoclavibacter sp. VKM Ac-2888]MBF4549476.1 helix-turn-helix domain-containing protein [Pseudoclavibacter sp. VKM Ac-2888]
MTNTILNTAPPEVPTAQAHLGIALEHLIAGALDESGTRTSDADTMHRDGLFMNAQLVIEAHFRDAGFSIARLARSLSVSERAVHAVFAALGTTPRRELERRRLSEVERLSAQALTRNQIFELAGFSSPRQFRDAHSRHRTKLPLDQ